MAEDKYTNFEDYEKWHANHKNDKAPSKKIIALGKKITDVAGHMIGGVKVEDPEYWGLAEIVTEEMAEVGLTMKKRQHYTFDQLCNMNKDKVSKGWSASKGAEALGFAANAQTDAVGFITAVKHLGELKDQNIESARQEALKGGANRYYVDKSINAKMRRGLTREQAVEEYMQEVVKRQDSIYEKRLGMMLKSDAAAKASAMNRKFAYLALTGRDYDVDTKSDLAEGAKQGYADFNAAWGEMSDRDRVLFDREAFGKSIADSAASEYKTLTGAKEEEVSDGDAAEPTA